MVLKTDVLIIGGGLVGASLALALRETRWSVALAEARPPSLAASPGREPSDDADAWDPRVYAISPASRAFLEAGGAWQRLDARRVEPVFDMRVHGDRGARLHFSAYDSGVAALAWIVEAGALAGALWSVLEGQPRLSLLSPAVPQALTHTDRAARVALADGRDIEARLVIGADGARSFVRSAAGIATREMPYGQSGVVANFACAMPHGSVASQWFRDDGVLAWLPLPGNRFSMVWSTPQAHADELMALDETALCERVAAAGNNALGALRLITPPATFPLVTLQAATLIANRVALAGDAAHVVHPLAGQGVNLGFADAQGLAAMLAEADRDGRGGTDPGARLLLRRYERGRAEDILAMRWATDGLARLFGSRLPGAKPLRNIGMDVVERLPMLKNLLVSRAIAGSTPFGARLGAPGPR